MPLHNMDTPRSRWEQGLRPPWVARLSGGQSPASSGVESDTESSSTESERSPAKRLEARSPRILPLPSMLQQRITEIDQQREELKIELQLEIALLEGELQEERNELRRHTLYLQTLQEEGGQEETHRQTDRQKVSSAVHTRSIRRKTDRRRQTDGWTVSGAQTELHSIPSKASCLQAVCLNLMVWDRRVIWPVHE
ncbi:unnamed protein product [Oncorhynchus mykiss]|uniref:Uncharacterized protein n=1 Tax=Oncorhynchus mykiss TaxID=8022 RepID=A0A060ZIE0_ONCMY|nr:unnamed protein product [Oncorhynchus mykiss]